MGQAPNDSLAPPAPAGVIKQRPGRDGGLGKCILKGKSMQNDPKQHCAVRCTPLDAWVCAADAIQERIWLLLPLLILVQWRLEGWCKAQSWMCARLALPHPDDILLSFLFANLLGPLPQRPPTPKGPLAPN
eukprot:CAMPEP_0174361796 /NCGR_PEP_ID=MMETSP0811_2-20130205/60967_1 /TAXON_ID=73025 ORGANISM="Eutreptiella gymnastica-like, Strain CCMP1594" /NCGR_SAMPLE_ID=MMETSP0811_2 /ASSEMBLY_ACC=CAM_ASM_000667 /LENGTH=130 /DNA_ID=CAMNT_0015498763 /DNA_START=226 /DNA_END=619 /DNA_ORIENTATION=+